ncbi:hypothetical protein HanIR_Chr01g0003621 [Helianthus annuus]|nr:hypothetical protein HanIR_Chr01g0003621 [Helianthus annuus]
MGSGEEDPYFADERSHKMSVEIGPVWRVLDPFLLENKFDLISCFENELLVGSLIWTKRLWPIKVLVHVMVMMKQDELWSLQW